MIHSAPRHEMKKHASRRQSGTEQHEGVAIEARCAFSLAVACVFWHMCDVPSLQS